MLVAMCYACICVYHSFHFKPKGTKYIRKVFRLVAQNTKLLYLTLLCVSIDRIYPTNRIRFSVRWQVVHITVLFVIIIANVCVRVIEFYA